MFAHNLVKKAEGSKLFPNHFLLVVNNMLS
jgi:hypothetical protein